MAVGSRCALAAQGEDGEGQQSLLCLARIAACAGQSWGGGSSACFASVARFALVGNGGVLGVVCWRGMSGHQWWRVGEALVFSQCCLRHAGVRRGGTRKLTCGGRGRGERRGERYKG
jgi:hypothetical protein